MSGFSTFAICGVGKLGSRILSALLDHPAASSITIRVLTRPGSPRPPITSVPTSVTFWPIDYTQPALADAQLVKALTGVEVVISAVGSGLRHGEDAKAYADAGKHIGDLPGFKSQRMVAHAAKKAGCQLFVPAEYGSPTHTLELNGNSFVRGKKAFQDELSRFGLPWLLVYGGMFPLKEPPRTSLPANAAALPPPPYETTRHHVAQFLAHLVLDLPQENLEWGIYMIRGCRREVFAAGQWVLWKSL